MDSILTLPYNSKTHDGEMKEFRRNLDISRKLCTFLVLTVVVNVILTYGLIFHPPPPSAAGCAPYVQAECPQLALPAVSNTARTIQPILENHEMAAEDDTETTALAVRLPGELAERGRLEDIRGRMNVAAVWAWPLVQGMAWWNMVAACRDVKDNASNTINCVWGIITSAITLAATGIQTAIWFRTLTNAYVLGVDNSRRDIGHPFHQDALDELSSIIGLNVSYHGVWDHAHLGLNYSEVAMENEDPLHVFGIKHPDGSESHFSYLGNSTGKHVFKTGLGAPVSGASGSTNTTNSTSGASKRQTVTEGNQYFAFGGVDFMVDPNPYDDGYLNYAAPDWNAVLAQVSCLWGSDPTSDMLLFASSWFQIYDELNEGTVAAGAMSMFYGSYKSLLPGMTTIPTPIAWGACSA